MSSVLPGVALVFASFRLLVSILIRLDLPTFERPMNAYSGFVSFGHIDTTGADSENSACLISIFRCFACKDRKKRWTNQTSVHLFYECFVYYALYSCQDLILMSFCESAVKASMKALARRTLVIKGMLWSIAPRRIR